MKTCFHRNKPLLSCWPQLLPNHTDLRDQFLAVRYLTKFTQRGGKKKLNAHIEYIKVRFFFFFLDFLLTPEGGGGSALIQLRLLQSKAYSSLDQASRERLTLRDIQAQSINQPSPLTRSLRPKKILFHSSTFPPFLASHRLRLTLRYFNKSFNLRKKKKKNPILVFL